MSTPPTTSRRGLARDVLLLQIKLLLDALRDVALSPLTLAAAALDFILAGRQPPRFFHAMLRLGQRSDDWIDLWAAIRGTAAADRANVDLLLARVEEVVSDPKTGARRARVLKRWAERELACARRRVAGDTGTHSGTAPLDPAD